MAEPILGVTRVGEFASTLLPVPVLAIDTSCFDAFVATADEAVRVDKVVVPDTVKFPVPPTELVIDNSPYKVIAP